MDLLSEAIEQQIGQGADLDALQARAPAVIGEVLPPLTATYTRGLYAARDDLLAAIQVQRKGLEEELDRLWHSAFASYETIVYAIVEFGAELNALRNAISAAGDTPSVSMLAMLHGRACTVAGEVLCLLRGGFADGAAARQRTLHELNVTINILAADRECDLLARYADYSVVEQHKDLKSLRDNQQRLRRRAVDQADIDALQRRYDEVRSRREPDFDKRPHAWAAPLFPATQRISFRDLENLAGFDHLRPFYNLANHSIHAGPRAAMLNLRSHGTGWAIGVGARTDANFAETAHAP